MSHITLGKQDPKGYVMDMESPNEQNQSSEGMSPLSARLTPAEVDALRQHFLDAYEEICQMIRQGKSPHLKNLPKIVEHPPKE